MKLIKFLRAFMLVALLGSAATAMVSCKDEDENPKGTELGTITGTVTDVDTEAPVEGVTVTVSGVEGTATTGSDGKYTVANVTLENHSVSFSKTGWLATSVTVAASKFDASKVATVNVTLQNASAKIQGTVTDATNNNAPLAGVTVDIGSAGSATTDAEGKYAIENLIVDSYTATFSKTGYPAITRTITSNDFVDGVATVNVEMGLAELLRGQTAFDLANANKWYYNDYRGGRNGNGLDNDWALDYLCITDYYGNIQEQNEGVALQTRNGEADQSNPADLNAFDSYIYGSKLITADNKYLTLSVRTHNASQEAPAYFGVQVVDLSAAEPAAVKIGETQERYGENYTEHTFDLSAYVGKEVIVAVGIYRAATGDYWKQLPIRRMIFTSTDSPDITVGPSSDGTEVVTGWKLTQEMVRSTMVNEKNTFTGITSVAGNRDGYYDAYRSWREVSHIADNWAFVRNPKDPEPFASQGYIIKTNATETGATIPQSYLYAKFAIAAGKNTLTLKGRTMSSGSRPVRYTYFKLIVMDEAAPGTPIAIAPTPGGTYDGEMVAGEAGLYKLQHYLGSPEEPDAYAIFTYDLSQFNGKKVVLMLGVYNVVGDTSENKLSIYSITLE